MVFCRAPAEETAFTFGHLVIGKGENPGDEVGMKVAVPFVPIQKFAIMRLDRLHMLILFLFLPNRNAFASINKRIVQAQPTVILVSYDGSSRYWKRRKPWGRGWNEKLQCRSCRSKNLRL